MSEPYASIWSCPAEGVGTFRDAAQRFATRDGYNGSVSWFEEGLTPCPRFRVDGEGVFSVFHTQGCKCGYCANPDIDRFDVVRADKCLCCGSMEGVEMEGARTMYHWNGEGEEPNRPLPLCRECAEEHHKNWDDQWADYNNSRL